MMFPPSSTRSDCPQQGVITFGLAGGCIVYRRLADLRYKNVVAFAGRGAAPVLPRAPCTLHFQAEIGPPEGGTRIVFQRLYSVTPSRSPRTVERTCKVDPGSSLPGSGGVCGGEDTDGGTVTLAADYCGGYAPQLPCGSSRLGGTSGHACREPSGCGACTRDHSARSYRTHASEAARSCLPP